MSFEIKPEDFPEEIIDGFFTRYPRDEQKRSLAAFLNLAIKHGIVSPPVQWTEITDDPKTWPPHDDDRVIVLREHDEECFGRYEKDTGKYWQVADVTWEGDGKPFSCFTDGDFARIFPTHWRPI